MPTKISSSIAKKIIIYVILFSSLITITTTAVQLYSEYNRDIESIDSRFDEISAIHLHGLASRVWVADKQDINDQLSGLKNLPFLNYLEVKDGNKILAKNGKKDSEQVVTKSYPILYEYQGKSLNIGTLLVQASLKDVYAHIFQQLWKILLSNAIKTFLVSGFILYLFNLLVTRHLVKIAHFTNEITINNLDDHLTLKRRPKPGTTDELDILINSLTGMQVNLHNSISDLSEAKKTILESRERYRNLLETSNAIPWELDLSTWRFTYVGPQVIDLLGFPQEKWYEEGFWQNSLHPVDKQHAIDYCIAQTNLIQDHEFEYRMLTSSGKDVWIRDSVNVISENAEPKILRGFMFDITKQKNTEIAIKEKEELLKKHQQTLLFLAKSQEIKNNSIQPAASLTNETICATLPASASAIWLYNEKHSRIQCIDCYDATKNSHIANREIHLNAEPKLEQSNLNDDMTSRPLDQPNNLTFFRDNQEQQALEALITRGENIIGKIIIERNSTTDDWSIEEQNFVNSAADIISLTLEFWKHTRTAEELAQYQKQLELLVEKRTRQVHEQAIIIDQIHDAVISTDLNNVITSWNKGAEELFSYSVNEVIGKSINILFSNSEDSLFNEHLLSQLIEAGSIELETSMYNKNNNKFYTLLSLSLLLDAKSKPKGIICYALDISDRKLAEKSLLQHAAELSAVNKELEAFAYTVSHDLRTPLRSISGFSTALLSEYNENLDAQGQDYLRRVDKAAHHMSELIDNILHLSRVTRKELKYEQANFKQLTYEIINQNNYNADIFYFNGKLDVQGDINLLKIAISNLVGNAVKYSAHVKEPKIEVGQMHKEDNTVYYVRDNGVGFDEKYAKNLFLPFQRLHDEPKFEGTGIGLATVQRIIDKHHGKIWAESEPNKGATFYFTIGKYYLDDDFDIHKNSSHATGT